MRQYLVKWSGLGYSDATWEERSAFDGSIVNEDMGEQVRVSASVHSPAGAYGLTPNPRAGRATALASTALTTGCIRRSGRSA